MRSAVRSLSPFPRRRKNNLKKNTEIAFHDRKRSTFEDPGLLETSAIEVVLESPPFTPRRTRPSKEEPRTPDLMNVSTSSEESANDIQWVKREDLRRKSFKQKFMKKKGATETSKGAAGAHPTQSPSREGGEEEEVRNPLESRRCFPFSVHAAIGDKSRGRSLYQSAGSKTSSDSSGEKVPAGKISTPLRRRARSLSKQRRVAATPASKSSPGPSRKVKQSDIKTPLMQTHMRLSTEDNHREIGDELPDPMIEERLVMRPRLLARLEHHGPPEVPPTTPAPQQESAPNAPKQITLGRQKSLFSEVSTPSEIKHPHPVVQRMEESILEATKNGKKIDRKLVYETLLKIADSLESPEEQSAMQREVALLLQEDSPPPVAKISVVPQDTFSPELSENLGPAFTPPRTQPSTTRVASRISKAVSRVRSHRGDDVSEDGFMDWFDDEEWESRSSASMSRTSTDDTVDFITDIFGFGSLFGKKKGTQDMRDDEDEGETEDDSEKVPESWNNFQPPPAVVQASPSRLPRIRSRSGRRKNNEKEVPDRETDNSYPKQDSPWRAKKLPTQERSRDRRAWWRKKGSHETEETPSRPRERSFMNEDDVLSLSSIESQQYRATPYARRRDVSPDPSQQRLLDPTYPSTEDYAVARRRSKSVDDRRRMAV